MAAAQPIQINRQNYNEACHHVLPECFNPDDIQAVAYGCDQQRANERSQDIALTAEQARPANDHGANGVEFKTRSPKKPHPRARFSEAASR